jgi:biotin carboxyl carrier protein
MAEKHLIRLGDEPSVLEIQREDGRTLVRRQGVAEWKVAELRRVGDSGLYLLMIDNKPTELYLERRRGGAIVTIGRHVLNYDVSPWRPGIEDQIRNRAAPSGLVRIIAPMTGSVVEVRCAPGAEVQAGDVLLVIESMKMNNELRAPAHGLVETVPVTAGQRIRAGDLLVSLQAQSG